MKKTSFKTDGVFITKVELFFVSLLLISLGVSGTLMLQSAKVIEREVVINTNHVEQEIGYFATSRTESGKSNGFYSYDGYFCVVTKGRTLEEITKTTIHELGHLFVHEDYDHFCNEELERASKGGRT